MIRSGNPALSKKTFENLKTTADRRVILHAKEIERLNNIIAEERNLTKDLNDTANEARLALIEMDAKIKSDKNTIDTLQSEEGGRFYNYQNK